MIPEPNSFANVIDALGGPAKADKAVGLKSGHAAVMKHRNSIPPSWWDLFANAGRECGVPAITKDLLQNLYSKRWARGGQR